MDENISNGTLARIFSIDFVLASIAAVFVGGFIWANLNFSISQAQDVAERNRDHIKEVAATVNAIERDVAVIKANQGNTEEKLDAHTKEMEEQRKYIKLILRMLGNK